MDRNTHCTECLPTKRYSFNGVLIFVMVYSYPGDDGMFMVAELPPGDDGISGDLLVPVDFLPGDDM